MARTTPQPKSSRQTAHKKPPVTASVILAHAMEQMSEWPNTWQVDDPDLPYGQGLLAEFKPFVTHLISVEQLSASSIRRHLLNLFLLGGELISQINYFEEKRRLSPTKLLDQSLFEDGGPVCRHVANYQQAHYDATCRKLHAFRHSRRSKPR
jgi:hypothetical protein